MPIVQLTDRATILASGPDAESLLQNVVTPDLTHLSVGEAVPGALLTPQGKILFDFLIARTADGDFRLECSREIAQDFLKRLMLYKLRAKVELSAQEEDVTVSWGSDLPGAADDSNSVVDRRFSDEANVVRRYGDTTTGNTDTEELDRLRIAHGVAESGLDYAPGDAFPHDILFDQNGGVGLKKGCFVGQEVVSRMQHRGTARRRLVIVRSAAPLPETGTALSADGKPLGTLGTVRGEDGLAIVRIDRAGDAIDAGTSILAGDVEVTLRVPAYANFSLDTQGKTA